MSKPEPALVVAALVLATFVALSLAARAAEEPGATDATELEPLIVYPSPATLDDALDLLRVLVAESAPCLGCNAVLAPPPRMRAIALLEYLLKPAVPPEVDEATYIAVDVRLHDAPDLEYLRP